MRRSRLRVQGWLRRVAQGLAEALGADDVFAVEALAEALSGAAG